MNKFIRSAAFLLLFPLFIFTATAQDEAVEEPETSSSEAEAAESQPQASSLPPSREEAAQRSTSPEDSTREAEIDPETGEPIETLRQMEVRERVERDLSDYVESLEDFKTGSERDRELINAYMDTTDQILNRWTVPFIGMSLAQRAAEKEREARLVAFEDEAKRRLDAIRQVDEEYHKVRAKDYYDTIYHARDSWYNDYAPRNQ